MPLPKLDELRKSASGAVEMASGRLEQASGGKFKLMKVSTTEAEVDEEASETSSRMEELTETYCPKMTFQQVCMHSLYFVLWWWFQLMSLRIVINDHDYERIIGLSLDFFWGKSFVTIAVFSHPC